MCRHLQLGEAGGYKCLKVRLLYGSFYLPSSPSSWILLLQRYPGEGTTSLFLKSGPQVSWGSLLSPQMPELWISLPPFLWNLFVHQRKLTPFSALKEADPIKVDANLPAPCPGPSPLTMHSDPLVYRCIGTMMSTREHETALALQVSQPLRGEDSGTQDVA